MRGKNLHRRDINGRLLSLNHLMHVSFERVNMHVQSTIVEDENLVAELLAFFKNDPHISFHRGSCAKGGVFKATHEDYTVAHSAVQFIVGVKYGWKLRELTMLNKML